MGMFQHQIMLTLLECVCECIMPAFEAVDIRGCKLIRCGPKALWVFLSRRILIFSLKFLSSLIWSQLRSCLGCQVVYILVVESIHAYPHKVPYICAQKLGQNHINSK